MNSKLVVMILIATSAMCLAGCSLKNTENTSVGNNEQYGQTVIANKEEVVDYLTSVIKGEAEADTFYFSPSDYCEFEVSNSYFFNNSVYIQAGPKMYRFQLNGNEIKSYIMYRLDA